MISSTINKLVSIEIFHRYKVVADFFAYLHLKMTVLPFGFNQSFSPKTLRTSGC